MNNEENTIYKVKMLCTHGGDHEHLVGSTYLTREEANRYIDMQTAGYYEVVEKSV